MGPTPLRANSGDDRDKVVVPLARAPSPDGPRQTETSAINRRTLGRRWIVVSILFHLLIIEALLFGLLEAPQPVPPPVLKITLVPHGPGGEGAAGGNGGSGTQETAQPAAEANAPEPSPSIAETAPETSQQEIPPPAPEPATTPSTPQPEMPPPTPAQPEIPKPSPPQPEIPPPAPEPIQQPTPAPTPQPPKAEVQPPPPPPPKAEVPPPPQVAMEPPPPPKPRHVPPRPRPPRHREPPREIARATPVPTPAPAPVPAPTPAPAQTRTAAAPATPGTGGGPGTKTGPGQGTEGAGKGAIGNGVGPGDDYLERLYRHLLRYKKYPPEAISQKQQGSVLIGFTIARDGTVSDAHIERSSGSPILDQATLALVQRASPAPPLPERFKGAAARVKFPIDYKLSLLDEMF